MADPVAGQQSALPPESTVFDGVTLPSGAKEEWWGTEVDPTDPSKGKRLNIPQNPAYVKGAAYTTWSVVKGDMVIRRPGNDPDYDVWEVLPGAGAPNHPLGPPVITPQAAPQNAPPVVPPPGYGTAAMASNPPPGPREETEAERKKREAAEEEEEENDEPAKKKKK